MNERIQRVRILAAGVFSLMLVMGVARFAYTPLLPLMQKQAGLGVADAGWLAAINYAGYITGAVIASLIGNLQLKDRLYRTGLVLALAATPVMGLTSDFYVWAVSRYVAGVGSAFGTLFGTGLILNWLIRHDHRSELGIHFSGVGLGVVGSAGAVELMSRWLDWHMQWLVLAAIGVLLLIPAWRWLPRPDGATVSKGGTVIADAPPQPAFLRLLLIYYFCAGVGYVVSATFIVAIINRLPGLSEQGTWVFLMIGLGAAPACAAWDIVARWLGEINSILLATVLQIVGILLPLAGGLASSLVGAALFGSTMMGIVSLVLTMVGRYYPTRPTQIMGKMTVAYGLAQILAPAVTGWLAERFGSYTIGVYTAAAVMLGGLLILLMLKAVSPDNRPVDTILPLKP